MSGRQISNKAGQLGNLVGLNRSTRNGEGSQNTGDSKQHFRDQLVVLDLFVWEAKENGPLQNLSPSSTLRAQNSKLSIDCIVGIRKFYMRVSYSDYKIRAQRY